MSSPYESWTVIKLKEELRKRGALLKGKKQDLLDRLVFYDQNNNFNQGACTASRGDPESSFWSPGLEAYKDINADSHLPPLSKEHIILFLERYSIRGHLGQNMYEWQYLLNARVAFHNEYTFLRGQCKSQMRKQMQYLVDIRLSDKGTIEATHCECAVGSGTTAHCKHVLVLLWAVEQMVREKKMILHVVSTQKLQTFHQPKKSFFGSPMKIETLPTTNINRRDKILFKPIDQALIDAHAYNDRVRNLTIGFCASVRGKTSNLALKHAFKPANLYAVIWDHRYQKVSPEEALLTELKLLAITDSEIAKIEELTRGQADNKEWHEIRRHHITASNVYSCCKAKTSTVKESIARRLINPTPFRSKATEHGKINESHAIAAYEKLGIQVKPCGLFISKTYPYLAASPDGLIGLETVLEVKCPYTQRFSTVSDTTIPFLFKDEQGNLRLISSHPYYLQIQMQMYITSRRYATLIVYTFVDMGIIDVSRDETVIREMLADLKDFYENHFQPALFEEYLYKNYGAAFFK